VACEATSHEVLLWINGYYNGKRDNTIITKLDNNLVALNFPRRHQKHREHKRDENHEESERQEDRHCQPRAATCISAFIAKPPGHA
jgi:hypothetical protein